MKSLLLLCLLTLASCGSKDKKDDTEESYKYSLNYNGCKTEKSFTAKQAYCDTLEDETANDGCALAEREELYKRDCGSDFKETNPLR